jgi:hypothetical protein
MILRSLRKINTLTLLWDLKFISVTISHDSLLSSIAVTSNISTARNVSLYSVRKTTKHNPLFFE